ncbi:hypothetical protein Gotur_010791 [Gossypium turneri]
MLLKSSFKRKRYLLLLSSSMICLIYLMLKKMRSQWIIRKYESHSCRREYLKRVAKKSPLMLGKLSLRRFMIVLKRKQEDALQIMILKDW